MRNALCNVVSVFAVVIGVAGTSFAADPPAKSAIEARLLVAPFYKNGIPANVVEKYKLEEDLKIGSMIRFEFNRLGTPQSGIPGLTMEVSVSPSNNDGAESLIQCKFKNTGPELIKFRFWRESKKDPMVLYCDLTLQGGESNEQTFNAHDMEVVIAKR